MKVKLKLENAIDRALVEEGRRPPEDVRSAEIEAIADTGAVMLVLPQDVVEFLGLRETRKVIVRYADERKEERPMAGTVRVYVDDRTIALDCIVGPPNSEPLLGQIILEALDLLVDPREQKLIPRPESPFLPELKLK